MRSARLVAVVALLMAACTAPRPDPPPAPHATRPSVPPATATTAATSAAAATSTPTAPPIPTPLPAATPRPSPSVDQAWLARAVALTAGDDRLTPLLARAHLAPSAVGVRDGSYVRILVTRRFAEPARARAWPMPMPCTLPDLDALAGLAWMLDREGHTIHARSPLSEEGWHCLPGHGVSEEQAARAARTALADGRFREVLERHPHHAPDVEVGLCCRSWQPIAAIMVTVRFVEPLDPSDAGIGVACEVRLEDPRIGGARWLVSLNGDEVLASDGVAASGESCIGLEIPASYP